MNSTSKPEVKKPAATPAKEAVATAGANATAEDKETSPAISTKSGESVSVFVSRRVWPD